MRKGPSATANDVWTLVSCDEPRIKMILLYSCYMGACLRLLVHPVNKAQSMTLTVSCDVFQFESFSPVVHMGHV